MLWNRSIAVTYFRCTTVIKSKLVWVTAYFGQAPSHYMNQCWPRTLSPYGVTRPVERSDDSSCCTYLCRCQFLPWTIKGDQSPGEVTAVFRDPLFGMRPSFSTCPLEYRDLKLVSLRSRTPKFTSFDILVARNPIIILFDLEDSCVYVIWQHTPRLASS